MDLVKEAHQNGYNVLVINPLGPPNCGKDDVGLESCDFSNNIYIQQAVEEIKTQFGQDSQIYACGFSLGSNYLLRHLATHEGCQETCGIRAAMSVSSAFCCMTAGV
jgi:predicted alpha/beta-fold hydrolase